MGFRKRKFESVGQALREVTALAKKPRKLAGIAAGKSEISPALRERIMLAVTSVNKCRYCTFVHSLIALKEGFSFDEIKSLLSGEVGDFDPEEREALLYAQHWADTGGNPSPEARQKLVETYGEKRTDEIETAIRAIMFGNYFGNTFDYLLHSVSGGKLG